MKTRSKKQVVRRRRTIKVTTVRSRTTKVINTPVIDEKSLGYLRTAVERYHELLNREKRRLWVNFIADYWDKATWGKIKGAFEVLFPGSHVDTLAVGEYMTLEAGVHVLEYALAPDSYRPPTTIVATNVARIRTIGTSSKRDDSLVLAVLENGTLVFSYLNGEELDYVRHQISAAFLLRSDDHHVDFRSRDILPKIIDRIIRGDFAGIIGAAYSTKSLGKLGVHKPNRWVVGWVDEPYHNVKTPILADDARLSSVKPGSLIRLGIGPVTPVVRWAESIAALGEGELGLVKSSDSEVVNKQKRSHLVLAVKGGHAWELLGKPGTGTPIRYLGFIH